MNQLIPIRVGVVGTGVMGGYHTRTAATLAGCQLVGIFDANPERAAQVAAQYGITPFTSLDALCAAVDAVIVASPTITHAEVAAACLQAGCHVLVEKPIAATVEEGQRLLALSQQSDKLLMVGHLERYNVAVSTMLSLLKREELFAFELQRLSPVPGRDRSVDIIFDLMIHDIDLALAIADSPVESVAVMGQRVRYDFIDHVTAMLRFASGVTATLTASALSQERVRAGRIFTQQALFNLNLATREVWVHRQSTSSLTKADGQPYPASVAEQLLFPNREPLAVEQEHFLQAIRTGTPPATNAAAGYEALRLAQLIQDRVNTDLGVLV